MGSEIMKKVLTLLVTFVLSMILVVPSGEGKIPMVTENSGTLEYTLHKGDEYEDVVSFENMRNTTINGILEAVNVECGLKCPSIVLLSEPEMDLAPGESMRIMFRLASNIMNEAGETDLSISLNEDNGNHTRLIEILVTIEHDLPLYGICCFTGIVSILLVGLFLYFIWGKKRRP